MMERIYCTLNEVIDDLDKAGIKAWKESQVMDKIRDASQFLENEVGAFIPVTEVRNFDGYGGIDLWVYELLAASQIIDDDDTLLVADYDLYGKAPGRPNWNNGPFHRIQIARDATTISSWSNKENVIAITGRWGFHEKTKDTGAIVGSQDDSSTDLIVDKAAGISPGAVLLIETEQEVIEATGTPTASTAVLNEGATLSNSDEEITVDDSSQVNIGEVIRVDFEQMMIRDIAGNILLVTRGWNGTKKVTHTDATAVFVYRTFTVIRGVNGTTAATHTTQSISRYIVPDDVKGFIQQTAALKLKKAESGYAGKVGNVELGEVFYHADYPKDLLKKLKHTYFLPVT